MPNIRGFGCSLVRHNGVAIAEHTVAASTSVFGSIIHSRVAPDDAGPLPFMVRIDNQGLSPAFFERQGTGDIAHHGAPQATAAACNGEQQVPGRAAVGSRLCVVLVVDSSLMFAHTLRSPTVRFLVPGRRIKPYSVESMRIVGGQTPTNIRVELWHCRVRHAAEGLSLWTNATPFDAQRTFLADESVAVATPTAAPAPAPQAQTQGHRPAAMQFASLECERLGQRPLLSFVFSAAPILVPSIVWPDINFLPRIDSSGVLSLRSPAPVLMRAVPLSASAAQASAASAVDRSAAATAAATETAATAAHAPANQPARGVSLPSLRHLVAADPALDSRLHQATQLARGVIQARWPAPVAADSAGAQTPAPRLRLDRLGYQHVSPRDSFIGPECISVAAAPAPTAPRVELQTVSSRRPRITPEALKPAIQAMRPVSRRLFEAPAASPHTACTLGPAARTGRIVRRLNLARSFRLLQRQRHSARGQQRPRAR